jgi:3'-phosphoadenosine 5'-phosphosulfate sulfotransferase (PAPS reductase)/FAD synthetase
MDKKEALVYVSLNNFKRLLERTDNFIKESLAKVENPYLACSFGKDSAVMLHLVLKQMPDIKVLFAYTEETELMDNYFEVITDWFKINPVLNLEKLYCEREPDGRTHSSEKMANKMLGVHDSYFVGLRAQESPQRSTTIKLHGTFFLKKDGMTRICPIGFWSQKDIEAYCLAFDVPTLNKYTLLSFNERTTSGMSAPYKDETLRYLKQTNMDAYNRMLKLIGTFENFD